MKLVFISHGSIKTRYDGIHLNDKGGILFTENILSALNKIAWAQNVKENSPKSFSESDDIRAKKMFYVN